MDLLVNHHKKAIVVEYDLTWLPGEFHLIDKQAIDGNTLMIYADDSGQRITFSYSHGDNATSLFVASDYTEGEVSSSWKH